MKGRVLVLTVVTLALCALQAQASVFSGSGGSSLQSVFNNIGYGHINVANYQTNLNLRLHGMLEFQLLSRSGGSNLSFGVLESRHQWWGTYHKHNTVFGRNAEVGATATYSADRDNTDFGFYISKGKGWRSKRYYSYSPFNRNGAIQALFYEDPLQSGSYLLAWNRGFTGNSHSDRSYDDLVVRMNVHPAPEPATWILLASGLIGLGVLFTVRRRQRELA